MTPRRPPTRTPDAPRPLRRAAAVALAGWALATAGCGADRAPAGPAALAACRLKGVEIAVRCGDVAVPERRDDPASRRIAIHFAVVPALARKAAADAVFVLAGGPGQSATDVAGLVHPLFAKINRERDLVFVDQRGTGGSHALSCAPETTGASIADEFDPAAIDERVARCAQRLAADADLTAYTTTIAMQDLDAVRARLGYETIDLWGASYGTRAALEYARQFPARVRTMTLDGVAPAWQKLPLSFGVDTHATIAALVAACGRDAACARRYPRLGADVDALLARTAERGAPADIADPVTGTRHRVVVTRLGLAQLLRTPLYLGLTASLLPAAFDRAAHGDFDALAALTYTVGGGLEEHLAFGMHLSVLCAEDVAAITAADRGALAAEASHSAIDGRPNAFATIYESLYRGLCARWPTAAVPAAFFEPLTGKPGANVPTLLLSGGIDPATPPRHADEVAKTLTRARHLIAPSIGHGVSMQGCAPDLIERFVRSADPQAVDGACLAALPRPPFYVPLVEPPDDHAKAALP